MKIQYRYAVDERDALIDVLTLNRFPASTKPIFRCVACRAQLVAKLGDIKAKHFAHKLLQSHCTYEGYLHQLAKTVFYSEYRGCLERDEPFYLLRKEKVTCNHFENKYGYTCARSEEKTYDLTEFFDRVSIEKGYNGFVADVLLESSKNGEVLFVEFAVTHRCEDEKKNSGVRIIEYSITSEEDLVAIQTHRIANSDERLSLYNLRLRGEKRPLCGGRCPARLNVFVIYASQKSILLELDPQREVSSQLRGKVRHYAVLGKSTGEKRGQIELYKQQARAAHFSRLPIKNCYVCKYHGGDGVENAVFCKVKKQSVGSNEAVECETYRPFISMAECTAQDKKNEAFVKKRGVERMIRIMLPDPLR